jgi:drug/metabolite transporter (DMT)-like permease
MPDEISGIPIHVLLVHAIVVLVPLTALLTVLSALWPAARRRIGIIIPLLGLITLILVPITQNAGRWLEARVGNAPLIKEHTDLGDSMLWFGIGLFVASLLAWGVPTLLNRNAKRPPAPWIGVVVAIIAVALAGASVVQVYRVGESGSKAVWEGSFCEFPVGEDGTCPVSL